MSELIRSLESRIPNVREVMLASLKNVRTSHLLDLSLLDNDTSDSREVTTDPNLAVTSDAILYQVGEPTPMTD